MRLEKEQLKILINQCVDAMGLILIGGYITCASIWQASFAKIHIFFPYTHFSIFVGEICLFLCLVLLIVKLGLKQQVKLWHQYWILYAFGICALTIYGLSQDGGLIALRNAAMFNYLLFALCAFSFYRSSFLRNGYVYWLVLIFFIGMAFILKNYYWLFYNIGAFVLLGRFKSRVWPLLLMVGFSLFHFKDVLLGSRSHLVAIGVVVIFITVVSLIYFVKWSGVARWLIAILLLCGVGLAIFRYADQNAIESMSNLSQVMDKYLYYKKYIADRERDFIQAPLAVKLYNPYVESTNLKQLMVSSIAREDNSYSNKLAQVALEGVVSKDAAGKSNKKKTNTLAQVALEGTVSKDAAGKNNKKKTNTLAQVALEGAVSKDAGKNIKKEVNTLVQERIEGTHESDVENGELNQKEFQARDISTAYNNILFRLFIWEDMIKDIVASRNIFGVGFGKIQRSRSIEILGWARDEWHRDGWIAPHNSYLHLIYRSGIIGLAIIVGFFVIFIRLLKSFIRKRSIEGVLLLGIILYWMVMANFLLILELPYYAILFWSLVGVTSAYARDLEGKIA